MPTRVQQAQGNGANNTTSMPAAAGTGAIVQAANQLQQSSQNAANRAQAAMGGGATQVPTISAFWKSNQPNAEAAIMAIPGFDMAHENRSYTTNVGTEANPNVQEVNSSGEKKPYTGNTLTEQYHSAISQIFDKLEKSGVSSNPGMVRAIVRDYFKPENRVASFGAKSIFNDPAFYQVANQGAGGGQTKLDNTINAIADFYSTTKRQRDAQFGVQPTTITKTVEATVTPPPATKPKVKVKKK